MKWKAVSVLLAVVAVAAVAVAIVAWRGAHVARQVSPTEPAVTEAQPEQQAPEQTQQPPQQPAVTRAETPRQPATKPKPAATETRKPEPAREEPKSEKPVVVATRTIPAGTTLAVTLVDPLSSADANVGDRVQATIDQPVVVDDVVLARAGSEISGSVTNVIRASREKTEETLARLDVVFSTLNTIGGPEHVRGVLSGGEKMAGSTSGRDAAVIVGSGVAGAVLGKVLGKSGKATAAGGVIGTAAGIGIAAMKKGNEVTLPAGTKLAILLETPVEVAVKR